MGAMGMLLAVVLTLTSQRIISYEWILLGIILGGAIGAVLAIKIEMTSMPELVAVFNGFGGIASVFVAGAALLENTMASDVPMMQLTIAIAASGLIGAVTFWGSLVAFGKLKGIIGDDAILLQFLEHPAGIFILKCQEVAGGRFVRSQQQCRWLEHYFHRRWLW